MSNQFWLRFGTGDPRIYAGLSPTFILFSEANGSLVTPPSITDFGGSLGMYGFNFSVTTPLVFLVDGTASIAATDRYIVGALDPNQRNDETLTYLGTSMGALSTSLGALSATIGIMGATLGELSKVSASLGALSVSLNANGETLLGVGNTVSAINQDLINLGVTVVSIGDSLAAMGITLTSIGDSLGPLSVSLGSLAAIIGDTDSSYGDNSVDPTTILGYLKRNQEFQEGNAVFTKSSGSWDIYSRGSSTLLREKSLTNDSTSATKN